jgi:hypothetical protein
MLHTVDEIPTDVYSKIPNLIYKNWNNIFAEISIYHDNIVNKKSRLPNPGERIKINRARVNFYLTKSESDPLDIEYVITFRLSLHKFKLVLHDFFYQYNLDFDFDLFYDKNKLLLDLSNELSLITSTNLSINVKNNYMNFKDIVIIRTRQDFIKL